MRSMHFLGLGAHCASSELKVVTAGSVTVSGRLTHTWKGPVTLLAMTQTAEGRLKMLAAQGESAAGETLKIGNTNSRIKFSRSMAE